MAKKSLEKTTKPPARAARAKRSDSAPAAEQHELKPRREPVQPAGKATAVAESPLPPASPRVKVNFVLLGLGAKQVTLAGDFNGWSPTATPMSRDSSGHWETTVQLAPGRYQYKFIVDGEWMPDPLARENVWNQHGTLNSVVEVLA
jgi:hypothetical protein